MIENRNTRIKSLLIKNKFRWPTTSKQIETRSKQYGRGFARKCKPNIKVLTMRLSSKQSEGVFVLKRTNAVLAILTDMFQYEVPITYNIHILKEKRNATNTLVHCKHTM